MKRQLFDWTNIKKGKHAEKHSKIRSDVPWIAIMKVEKAVAKRLRRLKNK